MKRIISVFLCLLLVCGLVGCASTPVDHSQSLIDADGNLTISDSDDDDLSAIDEEFEIKTSSGATGTGSTQSSSATTSGTTASGTTASGTTTSGPSGTASTGTNASSAPTVSTEATSSDSSDHGLPEITINLSKETVSDPSFAKFDGTTLKILKSGDFSLTGNFYGCIEAELGYNDLVRLRMAGANLLNTTGPVIKVKNLVSDEKNDNIANNPEDENSIAGDQGTEYDQPDLIISFTEGTTNTLEVKDCNLSDMIGTVYSECSLSIRGHGEGTIKNANQNAIHCLKSVEVRNCDLTLIAPAGRGVYTKARYENNAGSTVKISAYRDAVKCDKFYMYEGTLLAFSQKNDAIDCEDRAIISGGLLVADTADIAKNYGIKVRRILLGQVRPDKYDTFELTGGTVLAAGGFNIFPSADTSTAAYLELDSKLMTGAGNFAIKDSGGKALMAFSTLAARPSVLLVSPALTGQSTDVWSGGSISGGDSYTVKDNVIVFGSVLYSGGSYSGGKSIGTVQ